MVVKNVVSLAVVGGLVLLVPVGGWSVILALDPQKGITQYSHDVWQDKDGLPQNTVLAITQTRDGYLWLGTEEGLARFDGVRFTVFDTQNTKELKHNSIAALLETSDGSLWIGTRGGGLTRFKEGKFASYLQEGALPHRSIRALYEGRDGSLWIGTSGGLSRFEHGLITTYKQSEGLPNNAVRALHEDRQGRLWIGTMSGLCYFKDKKFITPPGFRRSVTVRAICEDRQGSIWVGTDGDGLYRWLNGDVRVYTRRNGLASNFVRALFEDRDGNLWIGTGESGLVRLGQDGRFARFTIHEGLSSNIVRSIYQDREGSLWVGTEGGGVNRLRDGKVITYTVKDGLSSDFVRAIYQDRTGAVWIGTEGGGLNRYKDGVFTAYTTRDGLLSNLVTSITEDQAGTLWIATEDGGLNGFKNGRLIRHPVSRHRDSIWAVYVDQQGSLWFGTSNGLYRWAQGQLKHYTTKEGLPTNTVRVIFEDHQGNIWIGPRLTRLREGQFTVYTTKEGMPEANVSSFLEDSDGTLWIGTDRGLLRWKDGKFTAYTADDGLFNEFIFQILEDNRGRLWMSSRRGIFFVTKQELNDFAADRIRRVTSVAYTTADGMKSSECTGESQPAGWRMRDGRLWFPTVKGVAVIDPGNLAPNPLPPPVVIEQVLVNQSPMALPTGVQLPPDVGELTIEYTGLSFLAPEKVRFKYKLEGLDDTWVDVGTRRAAYYTHLPPGQYRFRVIASNNDGIWNEEGASVEFSIRPHWYQTPWAYALGAVSLLLMGLALHRLHVKRMEREFAAVLTERNRVARELHDTLLQGFAGTALQLEAITHTLPDSPETAKEKLIRILNQVDRCLTEARRSIWALRSPTLEGRDLVTVVSCLVQQLTAGTPIQSEVSVSGTPRRLPEALETNLLRIVQEAITNAVKHARADRIHVSLGFENGVTWVKVRDNGCGFQPSSLVSAGGTHLGLVGMRERAKLLGGHLSLSSHPGQGTEVAVTVPIKERGFASFFTFIPRLVSGADSEHTKTNPHHVR